MERLLEREEKKGILGEARSLGGARDSEEPGDWSDETREGR